MTDEVREMCEALSRIANSTVPFWTAKLHKARELLERLARELAVKEELVCAAEDMRSELERELAEAREDTKRLDWLESGDLRAHVIAPRWNWIWWQAEKETRSLRTAIDTARASERGGEEGK